MAKETSKKLTHEEFDKMIKDAMSEPPPGATNILEQIKARAKGQNANVQKAV